MSIEEQIRKKQMSIEESVRQKQAFEDGLDVFLSIASSMTNPELEIALARLADILRTNAEETNTVYTKGSILNIYYQMRASGIKKQSSMARMKWNLKAGVYFGEFGEYLINKISSYPLTEPKHGEAYYPTNDIFKARVRQIAP